jgi:hypothetical protein
MRNSIYAATPATVNSIEADHLAALARAAVGICGHP